MVTQYAKRPAFGLQALVVVPLLLSGCLAGEQQQFFDELEAAERPQDGSGGIGWVAPGASPPAGGNLLPGQTTRVATESFSAASAKVKKIDFLFVVDNSGSMGDDQARLAQGFEKFANTFYRRADLDICTAIITTDRYLGKFNGTYARERTVACTQPAGSATWSEAQRQAHVDSIIADFKVKVNVGTRGSGMELPGKSLVAFLYNQNSYSASINSAQRVSFFRSDAVANVSFVTDENNWFFQDSNKAESSNDLPPTTQAVIYNHPAKALDSRTGIKNHLDQFFTLTRPGQGLSYSVVALVQLQGTSTSIPGLAMNVNPLVELVGRESNRGDLLGNANQFAAVYEEIGENIVTRAGAVSLSQHIYEPNYPNLQDLRVSVVRSNGTTVSLNSGSDFTVLLPNGISVKAEVLSSTQSGDQIRVVYRHIVK